MKKINIDGVELDYEIMVSEFDEWTYFYQGTKKVNKRKYFLFGPLVEVIKPIFVFKVGFNIESEFITKDVVRSHINRGVELLNRKEEIKRGEII
jgi:hypothetical protein